MAKSKKLKPSMTENLLRMSGVFKDYDKALKLYDRYNSDKLKLKTKPNQVDDLLSCVKGADTTLKRFITAYSKANEEVKSEKQGDGNVLFIEQERNSYLNVLKGRATKIQQILTELTQKPVDTSGKPAV